MEEHSNPELSSQQSIKEDESSHSLHTAAPDAERVLRTYELQASATKLNAERLARIDKHSLKSGGHKANEPNGSFDACVMEAVAWVAGEPWSDAPECACPVITAFMVSWNDSLPNDAERDRLLKPLIPYIVGTRSTPAIEQRRSLMAADWLIRVHTPAWLRAAKLESQAAALEGLPEITDMAQCPSLMPVLNAVRKDADAARAAAGAAARNAARAAARNAARAAARAAAGAAAWDAAWAAARDAAWDAAWAAARDAAWAAARAALKPTTTKLQDSAVELVKRMCALSETA